MMLSPAFHTVLVVSECGSFSAAARVIGISQSTVSRQISALEDRIGISLFERSSLGLRPTDAGDQLIARIRHISGLAMVALEEAQDAGAARTGRLRWGFVGSFVNPQAKEVLSRLRRLHPELKVQLAELGATELVRQVLSHQLDCAWVASWRSPDPALVFEPLWSEPLYLAAPEAKAVGHTVRWMALAGEVLLTRPEAELDLLFPELGKAGVTPPEVQVHDCSRESLMALVAEDQGVAIVPESFARMGQTGVQFARIDEPLAEVAVFVVYRRDRDNPALRRLLAITRDWLRASLPRPGSPNARA